MERNIGTKGKVLLRLFRADKECVFVSVCVRVCVCRENVCVSDPQQELLTAM